jgi:hypothetical protein
MITKLIPVSPLHKRQSTLSHISTEQVSTKNASIINELYNKVVLQDIQFVTINQSIEIESDLSALNMVEYGHGGSKQSDQYMLQAKLKRLENMAEMKRANMVRARLFRSLKVGINTRKRKCLKI